MTRIAIVYINLMDNNLSNVEKGDFESAIDDVISTINSDIEDLKQEEM